MLLFVFSGIASGPHRQYCGPAGYNISYGFAQQGHFKSAVTIAERDAEPSAFSDCNQTNETASFTCNTAAPTSGTPAFYCIQKQSISN